MSTAIKHMWMCNYHPRANKLQGDIYLKRFQKKVNSRLSFQQNVSFVGWRAVMEHPAVQEVTNVKDCHAKVDEVKEKTGCHVTLQFAEKSNPAIRKDIASMFIALLEGREITQAKK